MKLKNKIAIITGSGNGIGKSTALELARQGAKVVVCDIDLQSAKKVSKQIKNLGRDCFAIKCDVTNKKDVDRVVYRTIKEFKRIDILVNNAGLTLIKPLEDCSEEDWDKIINVNLKSIFLFSKAVSPQMIKQKKGKIININSIGGEVGLINSSAYCASKGGVVNLTRELAMELSPHNINVNGIAPGIIITRMTEDILNNEKTKNELLSNIPLNRFGSPEEISDAVVFLASRDSNFISGHNLAVDGGWLTY